MKPNRVVDHLAEVIEGDGPPSPECWAWLRSGFRRFIAGEAELPGALRLTTIHSRGPRFGYRYHRMTASLQRAAATIPAKGTWSRAELLAAEVRAFGRIRWKRWAAAGYPPSTATDLEKHLFEAFANGPVPASVPRLYTLLSGESATLRARPSSEVDPAV